MNMSGFLRFFLLRALIDERLKKAIIICYSSLVQQYSSLESSRAAREAMRVARGLSLAALVKKPLLK